MIKPQLAFDVGGDFAVVPREGWVMEPKLDGWRWQVHVTENGVRSIGGRNGADHSGHAATVDEALAHLPAGTVLDGELVVGGSGISSDVTHAMAAKLPTAFYAFDVLAVAGKDVTHLPWRDRRELLEAAVEDTGDAVVLVSYFPVDADFYKAIIDAGFEGIVAKRKDAPYRPGSRRRDGFLKVKPADPTTDAIVTGWVFGKGASNGHLAGALKVTLVETGAPTTVGWEGTPAEADAMVGRRIEVKHWGFMPSGKVRHPNFVRTREDLEQEDDVGKLEELTDAKLETNPPEVGDPGSSGWMRNYGSMKESNLLRCIRELAQGEGPAVDRVVGEGGSIQDNLTRAREVARGKGLA